MKMIKSLKKSVQICLFLGFIFMQISIYAKNIAVVFYCAPEISEILKPLVGQKNIHLFYPKEIVDESLDLSQFDKILFFGHSNISLPVSKEKLILFKWEPGCQKSIDQDVDRFHKIYTWKDSKVDNVKIFQVYHPALTPMLETLPDYHEKKFCIIITSNWTLARRKIVEFFAKKAPRELDMYGRTIFPEYKNSEMNKGMIPGLHLEMEKLQVMKNYKFCFCFENTMVQPGYISEKIFACFAAGCVPVYWGAPNVEEYIPKGCFIDFRNFKSLEEAYDYLKSMPKAEYDQYIQNIKDFYQSEKSRVFSRKYYLELINNV